MRRRNAFAPILAVAALGWPAAADADGLYLKISTDTRQVEAESPVKVNLTAVGTRTLVLPATPVFSIDAGQGYEAGEAGSSRGEDVNVVITPDRAYKTSYDVALPGPGRYRIRAEYRVGDRVIRSNAVKVEVTAPQIGRR